MIISVAADDRDGLPDQVVLENLAEYPLLRTDQNGWIAVSTDGEEFRIEVEHPAVAAP